LTEGRALFAKQSDIAVLEAHKEYWDRKYPKIKKIVFENSLMGNRHEAMRLCRDTEGAVDIVNYVRPLDALKVAKSPFAKIVKSSDVVALTGMFNQRKKGSRWRDIRLRKAINYAINREELRKYAAKGNAHNLGGYIPPGAYGHTPNLPIYKYDTTKAKFLLEEAGYPDGFEVKIIASQRGKLEAQVVRSMFKRIGLSVDLEVLTYSEFLKKTYIPLLRNPPEEQDWDLTVGFSPDIYGHTGATLLAFGLIEESDFRWIQYDPVYEELWKNMAQTVDPRRQEERIRHLQQYIYDQAYRLFIYSPLTLYAVNNELEFIPQKSGFLPLKETSVTENHWSVRGQNN
jgi:peptide/nickel transport system substrate-binding protein